MIGKGRDVSGDSVLAAIGDTPTVRLARVVPAGAGDVFAKLENLNLGGSIKTRTALGMIEAAEREGRLGPTSVLVEPTSGNQGIAVAQIAAIKGYRARIVMPESMSVERRLLIEAYGAEVVLTPVAEDVAQTFALCIEEAQRLAAADENVVVLQQFENAANPQIHYETTAPELFEQMDGRIDALVAGVGTGGTITGIGRYLRERVPRCLIVAVEPEGAQVIAGGTVGMHRQQGIGDGFIPSNLDLSLVDRSIAVSDDDAVEMCHRLAREEGLAVGISSGSNTVAAIRIAEELGEGMRVATILADTAERYWSLGILS